MQTSRGGRQTAVPSETSWKSRKHTWTVSAGERESEDACACPQPKAQRVLPFCPCSRRDRWEEPLRLENLKELLQNVCLQSCSVGKKEIHQTEQPPKAQVVAVSGHPGEVTVSVIKGLGRHGDREQTLSQCKFPVRSRTPT